MSTDTAYRVQHWCPCAVMLGASVLLLLLLLLLFAAAVVVTVVVLVVGMLTDFPRRQSKWCMMLSVHRFVTGGGGCCLSGGEEILYNLSPCPPGLSAMPDCIPLTLMCSASSVHLDCMPLTLMCSASSVALRRTRARGPPTFSACWRGAPRGPSASPWPTPRNSSRSGCRFVFVTCRRCGCSIVCRSSYCPR